MKKTLVTFAFALISLMIFAQVSLVDKISGSSAASKDHFGYSAKMDNQGLRTIFGAYRKRINSLNNRGAAYIFIKNCNDWTEEAMLINPNGSAGDEFGTSVSISGNGRIAVVGAPMEGDDYNRHGAVYIFERTGSSWSSNPVRIEGVANDKLGKSVDIDDSGNRIVIGVPGGNKVVIYDLISGTWTETATVYQPTGGEGTFFGGAVAISGNGYYIGVGALGQNGGGYILNHDGNDWNIDHTLAGGAGSNLGNAVSVNTDGRLVVFGAHQYTTIDNHSTGAIYVVEREGVDWDQPAEIIFPTLSQGGDSLDHFAWSVAISDDGSNIIAGAYQDSSINNTFWRAGSAYLYSREDDSWNLQQKLSANPDESDDGFFGYSVAINSFGNIVGVGESQGENNNLVDNGLVYLFEEGCQNQGNGSDNPNDGHIINTGNITDNLIVIKSLLIALIVLHLIVLGKLFVRSK